MLTILFLYILDGISNLIINHYHYYKYLISEIFITLQILVEHQLFPGLPVTFNSEKTAVSFSQIGWTNSSTSTEYSRSILTNYYNLNCTIFLLSTLLLLYIPEYDDWILLLNLILFSKFVLLINNYQFFLLNKMYKNASYS